MVIKTKIVDFSVPSQTLHAFVEYALLIGCKIVGDEIECNAEQGIKLHKWWELNNGISTTR